MAGGIFQLGNVIDGFAGRKLKQIKYSDALDTALNNAVNRATTAADTNAADIGEFSSALRKARGVDQGMQADDIAMLRKSAARLSDTGGLDTYRSIGDYNFGKVAGAAKDVADLGSGAQRQMEARLGYSGRGPTTTYTANNLLDRVSKNLAGLYGQALSGITPGVNAVMANDRANSTALDDAIAAKAGIPYRDAQTILLPGQARNADLAALVQLLSGIGGGIKSNTAGFKEEKNKWAAGIGAIDDGLNSAVDTAMQLYTGMSGGGLLGGAMGALGGSGGGGMGSLGGLFSKGKQGGGSGGITLDQILQLVNTA